jgi:hypothetical protein
LANPSPAIAVRAIHGKANGEVAQIEDDVDFNSDSDFDTSSEDEGDDDEDEDVDQDVGQDEGPLDPLFRGLKTTRVATAAVF